MSIKKIILSLIHSFKTQGVHTLSDMDTCKAREHTILVNERPAYVTILCLVRDAVARLPEGEGTRVDVSLFFFICCYSFEYYFLGINEVFFLIVKYIETTIMELAV